jgi:spermidine/putrescine-binding protein
VKKIRNLAASILSLATFAAIPAARGQEAKLPRYNYPTSARADYVIGCMAANGFQRQLLDKCACGIDVIADRLDYDDYQNAETILSMQQAGVGPRGGLFRDTPVAKESLEKLRRAQAEANLRCGD